MSKITAEYIDHMGSDVTVVNAARVSFDKEIEHLEGKDEKLIEYLAEHNHWTPFAHPHIMIRETVPIFVARQRFKHMVGFTYNEVSRRYVDTPPEFYVPEEWRSRPEGGIKQGSGTEVIDLIEKDDEYGFYKMSVKGTYDQVVRNSLQAYKDMLNANVAPEMARMTLPQSMMTSYYVTGSLAAWARMVKQRKDSHAQIEIQELAKIIEGIIEPVFPIAWRALTND